MADPSGKHDQRPRKDQSQPPPPPPPWHPETAESIRRRLIATGQRIHFNQPSKVDTLLLTGEMRPSDVSAMSRVAYDMHTEIESLTRALHDEKAKTAAAHASALPADRDSLNMLLEKTAALDAAMTRKERYSSKSAYTIEGTDKKTGESLHIPLSLSEYALYKWVRYVSGEIEMSELGEFVKPPSDHDWLLPEMWSSDFEAKWDLYVHQWLGSAVKTCLTQINGRLNRDRHRDDWTAQRLIQGSKSTVTADDADWHDVASKPLSDPYVLLFVQVVKCYVYANRASFRSATVAPRSSSVQQVLMYRKAYQSALTHFASV